jgi:glycosyltransferase involved in cell wall biosynthesis
MIANMNINLPSVSVIMPTFNHASYIRNAIESVLAQTYNNFEIIIIDNYSKDSTESIVSSYTDERIRYYKFKNNGVIASSRNYGIKMSRGEIIAFLDSDDTWYVEKLNVCLRHFNESVDIVYHDLKIDGKTQLFSRNILKSRILSRPVLIDLLVNGNTISNSSVVVRKNIVKKVGRIDESKKMIAAEDYNLWLKIAETTDNFFYIPKILGSYLIGNEKISNKNMSVCSRNASYMFKKHLNKKQLIRYNSILSYANGRYFFLKKEYDVAMPFLIKSFKGGAFTIQVKSLYMINCMLVYKL